MPQGLRIQVVDGIVRAEVSVACSLSNAKAFFLEILGQARDRGVGKILIDARSLEGDISTIARFDFGTFMTEARPASIRIAFIGSEQAVWPDRFLELVAMNRGVLARVTTDEDEAIEWLGHHQSLPAG